MIELSYYFNHQDTKRKKQLQQLVENPLFVVIVNYLYERQKQDVILRQLKSDISASNLEAVLEEMIQLQLVQRKNKRYSLSFPIYNVEDALIPENWQEMLLKVPLIEREDASIFYFGEILWNRLFYDEDDYFYALVANQTASFPFYTKSVIELDDFSLTSIHPSDEKPVDLPTYFYSLRQPEPLPEEFLSLAQLIGDVDIPYFLTQMKRIIKGIEKQRKVTSKRNIFQEALLLTNLIKEEGDTFKLMVPNFRTNKKEEFIEEEELFDQLRDTIEDENKKVFFKQLLYQDLVKRQFQNHSTLLYIKSF